MPTPDLSHVYLLELGEGVSVQQALASYRADPHVEYVQPNFRVQAQFTPNDPFFHSSGSWGQPERDLWGLLLLEVEDAWDISQGEGVVVAVTDSGRETAEAIDADGALGLILMPNAQQRTRSRIRIYDPLTARLLQEIVPGDQDVGWFTAKVQNGILIVSPAGHAAFAYGPK